MGTLKNCFFNIDLPCKTIELVSHNGYNLLLAVADQSQFAMLVFSYADIRTMICLRDPLDLSGMVMVNSELIMLCFKF